MTNFLVTEAVAARFHVERSQQEDEAARVGGVDPDNLANLRERLAGRA